MLSRDNGILEELSLKQSMMVFYEDDGISPIQEFNCYYYAGDLDDYIAENEGAEKVCWEMNVRMRIRLTIMILNLHL